MYLIYVSELKIANAKHAQPRPQHQQQIQPVLSSRRLIISSQVRVSSRSPANLRHEKHIQPQLQRGVHTQLWHALREQHIREERDNVLSIVDTHLVEHLFCLHLFHHSHLPDRHDQIQIPRTAHHLPQRLLHARLVRLLVGLEQFKQQFGGVPHAQKRQNAADGVLGPGSRARSLHTPLHDDLLFWDGLLHLVGSSHTNLVFGGWS